MKRGEIYYIQRRDTVGREITKARPGIVVSHDALNNTSDVIEVVYLTTKDKGDMPTHVTIKATGIPSTALCEQIDSVSTMLVMGRCGTCTPEEMEAVDKALLASLGLSREPEDVKEATKLSAGEARLMEQLGALQAERDRYAKMLDVMLGATS